MATRRYKISAGAGVYPGGVTEEVGAATDSDTVELTVDLADGMTREEVLNALTTIRGVIATGNWPPA